MADIGKKQKSIIFDWLRLMFSPKGIWFFIPGIVGVLFVYWAEAFGYQALLLKAYHEPLAINLLAIATALFLIRAVRYRLEIDFILALMCVNFLCREIHFIGTDNALVIVNGFDFFRTPF